MISETQAVLDELEIEVHPTAPTGDLSPSASGSWWRSPRPSRSSQGLPSRADHSAGRADERLVGQGSREAVRWDPHAGGQRVPSFSCPTVSATSSPRATRFVAAEGWLRGRCSALSRAPTSRRCTRRSSGESATPIIIVRRSRRSPRIALRSRRSISPGKGHLRGCLLRDCGQAKSLVSLACLGSGKSTLAKVVAGAEAQDAGTIDDRRASP